MKRVLVLSAAALSAAVSLATIAAAGSEEYEMTTYQVAFYRKGPAWTPGTTPELERLQSAHLAHIGRMADSGKLLVAGPFTDNGDLRGMLVFRVESPEEAKAMAEQDPAVKAGRLVLEWHPWFAAKNIVITPTSEPGAAKPKP